MRIPVSRNTPRMSWVREGVEQLKSNDDRWQVQGQFSAGFCNQNYWNADMDFSEFRYPCRREAKILQAPKGLLIAPVSRKEAQLLVHLSLKKKQMNIISRLCKRIFTAHMMFKF